MLSEVVLVGWNALWKEILVSLADWNALCREIWVAAEVDWLVASCSADLFTCWSHNQSTAVTVSACE